MKIRILTIGKLKEKYGINEYVKRLNAYCKVEMVEVPDEPIPDNASENVENIIKDKEADKIVSKIKDDELVNPTLMENFTIVGVVGSNTQTYAVENNIPFIDIETGELPEIPDNPTKNNFVNGVFCDVNGDGVANIIDLLIVKKTILGM